MKTKIALLLAFLLGISSTPAFAAECTSSFYCYGNTASSVVRVNPRPPPIPPPNRHIVQQRRQAQLALRNHPTPRIARPAVVTPAPQARTAVPTVAHPIPRANINMPARQPSVRLPPPNHFVGNCTALTQQASALESQAVIASQHNDRQGSVMRFRDAANLRQQAVRLNCR